MSLKKVLFLIDAERWINFVFSLWNFWENLKISVLFATWSKIHILRCKEEPGRALIPLRLHRQRLSFQGLGARFQTSASTSTILDKTRRGDIPHIDHANMPNKEPLCLCVGGGTKKNPICPCRPRAGVFSVCLFWPPGNIDFSSAAKRYEDGSAARHTKVCFVNCQSSKSATEPVSQ